MLDNNVEEPNILDDKIEEVLKKFPCPPQDKCTIWSKSLIVELNEKVQELVRDDSNGNTCCDDRLACHSVQMASVLGDLKLLGVSTRESEHPDNVEAEEERRHAHYQFWFYGRNLSEFLISQIPLLSDTNQSFQSVGNEVFLADERSVVEHGHEGVEAHKYNSDCLQI